MKIVQILKNDFKKWREDESGIATVEVILLLVVAIALVLIFKDRMTTIVNNIFDTIEESSASV